MSKETGAKAIKCCDSDGAARRCTPYPYKSHYLKTIYKLKLQIWCYDRMEFYLVIGLAVLLYSFIAFLLNLKVCGPQGEKCQCEECEELYQKTKKTKTVPTLSFRVDTIKEEA
ncbi:hypothetical protein RR48_06877 [Papilio machaon]|uniref:Uncharacterized protein n=1 Tax=Papilio machaon TaxID=76193 RepID=A0A194RA36_PAPMA|nr:hypothetical protein RR48_06877 [Papilio machaon]